ncbi:MAG: sugar phosphate isomerase/epimerase [Actinobacteria bacterium]|nr:sugar phosphate isomerase/epimerase [Actinomycetota bacterium]MBU4450583.1 sugar phosphate isomerase/epimerase [Actinomycetota bacterium]MCG2789421.1 sugar phosphate isomerase/epimerase [Actinomycetes bacterium]
MKLNVDAHLWCLGTYAERYVPGGYFDEMTVDQQLEIMSKIKGLTGLFTFYPTAPLPNDPDKLVKKVESYGLKVSNLAVECWGDRRWKHGSFCTNDPKIRNEAIKLFKEAIDFARAVKADSVLLWPAHDGYDYVFQVNYVEGWKYLVETVREICEYAKDMKIAIEAKPKDPRQKQYISDTGKAMAFVNDVGLENVGCALDIGHALAASEGIGESVALLDYWGKLYQIHINENYKDADPDMIFGTVNFWEILEFYYYLNKTKYEGWCAIDIIAPRDDRIKSMSLGVKLMWKYQELALKLLKHEKEIDANLKGYRFADNMDLITDLIF